MRLMFQAMVTKLHSPWALASPRMLIWRQPITLLMMPNTGSTVCLRRPYNVRPACVPSRCAICTTGSVDWGCGASGAKRCAGGA